MKHTITLSLQQITDLEAIHTDLVTRGDKCYAKASSHAFAAAGHRETAAKEKGFDIRMVWLNAAQNHEGKADDCNAEGDRLMTQAAVIHSIISQIKKNG
jgi:hypothetical protein